MRTLGLAIAAGAILAAAQANAGSFPVNTMTGAASDLVDQVAVRVYVHEGHRYCFYFNGWHGPGWYRCGFAFRRGVGWGGVYGWNNWNYGPYERRIGGRTHHGERISVESGSRRTNNSVETRTRSTTRSGVETRTRSMTGSGVETRTRSTTGSGVEGAARVRGGTKGSKPDADVQSSGGAKVQGGPTGEGTSVRGGGNPGGGSAGEGNSKRQ
jgi:hypothetical protein